MKTSATRQIFRLQTLFRALALPKVTTKSTSMPSLTKKQIEDTIAANKVVIYSKTTCPFCVKAKKAMKDNGIEFLAIELDQMDNMSDAQDIFQAMTGARSVPRVFVNGKFHAGGDKTAADAKSGTLKKMIDSK